jgi:hypothetical protein
MKKMYSVKEAASNLLLSERHVRYLLIEGQAKVKHLGPDWAILKLDYKHRRRPQRTKGGE